MDIYEKLEKDGNITFELIEGEPTTRARAIAADFQYLLKAVADPDKALEMLRLIWSPPTS